MKIAFATDHAGFELKEELVPFVESLGHKVKDFGAFELDGDDDFNDFVVPAVKAVVAGKVDRAIILGNSGQGEAMAANRIKGARAAVFYGGVRNIPRIVREHNDANVLSLGAGFLRKKESKEVVQMWLEADFSEEERYIRRNKKLDKK